MKQSHLPHVLSAFVMLFAILACALPGQAGQPVTSPNAIETAVAGTSQAAAQQTAAAQLFTATPEGPTGTVIEQSPDGTTKYTDYDAGFEVHYPVGWLTVRPGSAEFNAALVGEANVNSMLHDQMAYDISNDAVDEYRLYSYILRPDIKQHVLFGFSKVRWDPEDSAVLDNVNMGQFVRDLEAQTSIPGFRVDTAQIHDEMYTRVIEIGGRWTLSDGTSDPVVFYSIFYFFKPTQSSTVRIAITTIYEYKDQMSIDMKSIMSSIKLLEP